MSRNSQGSAVDLRQSIPFDTSFLPSSITQPASIMPSPLKSSLDDLINKYTSVGDEGIPGVSLVVTRSSGNVYEGAAGLADLSKPDQPMSLDTVMWIASMSKAITSVAALQCVERGHVGLDDDLSRVIPELKDLQVVDRTEPYEDGSYTLKPATKKVTLRHLLTHSNGLIYSQAYKHSEAYAAKIGVAPLNVATRAVFGFPSFHEAGTEWHYGMGIDYAGLMIEILTGRRLDDFVHGNIFKPLGMSSTSFILSPEMKTRLAQMYARQESGKLVPSPIHWPHNPEQDIGGGGLWSTASDYAKFIRMLLSKGASPSGNSILKPETLAMAVKGHLEPEAKSSCNEKHMETHLSKWPGVKRDYSLIGMVFEEELSTGRAAGSIQWDGMPSCHWSVDTTKDIGIVQCVQVVPFGDSQVQKLLREVETETYKALGR